jgi:rubrerythrin
MKETGAEECVTKSQHTVVYAAFFFSLARRVGLMSQVVKRKSTSETKAGQYMCPECGQIFNDKKSVDSHIHMMHEPRL